MKLIMTKGLPASGKSTWARSQSGFKRINKDDLRMMMDNGKWSKANEQFILLMRDTMIISALEHGFNVIVDDTNLHPKHFTRMMEIADCVKKEFVKNVDVEIRDFTDVPIETCIKRDLARPNSVGEKTIKQMYKQFLAPKPEKADFDLQRQSCIVCDIDGTLAIMKNRSPFDWSKVGNDDVNTTIVALLTRYRTDEEVPLSIILVSGRDEVCRKETEDWLDLHCIDHDALFMRPKGDMRKDSIVKREIYENNIKGKFNVEFVLDDRNQVVEMWRSLGLTVFQVADGEF